ncbi:MAG: hypothetical protein J0L70_26995 [Leptolyngbya sp. UWPOB_LEPTO1]|uniref:hypothetical protein n=1 Tax=Leptolyngbya sp. UWPOB_LEPTO1 TaxID=2815653 RepID=UPI001AD09800|nr:hypothetical protein [Leptolyngbya sp. UWPOB_LEPTO1]MBN8564185.1 hypothetical protein [Leptolyngbya sp. UWPOB_LEPTO1]
MPYLRVPEEHVRGIKLLIDIEDKVFRALLNAVDKVCPTLSVEKVATDLAAEVKGIDLKDLEEITQAIVALQVSLNGEERDDSLIERVVTELSSSLFEHEEFSNYSDDQIARFSGRIHALLTANGVFKTFAKAFELRIESERILADARILTDVRPIFQDEIDEGMSAAIVSHTLRITYRDATGQREFYTALDELGLDVLLEQIVRAKEKTEAIRSMLEKASIPYLDPYTD